MRARGSPRLAPRRGSALARALGVVGLVACAAGCTPISRQASAYTDGVAPAKKPDLATLYAKDARLSVLWIGHASVLVRMDDRFFLADPVFTNQVGMLSRRLVAPGMTPEELPPGVTVLISHAHFDHLSIGSLAQIQSKVRRAYLPPGAVSYLPDLALDARELAPWRSEDDLGLKVTAVPVTHRAGRYGFDGAWNDATYTGYVVEYHGLSVFFGGDTGYDGALFQDVQRRFPPIDLAILPIGPIHPREFMRPMHIDGYEAVAAFRDLGARYMLPMHFGTFVNSTDAEGEDLARFRDAVSQAHVDPSRAFALSQGEAHTYIRVGDEPRKDEAPSDPTTNEAPPKEEAPSKSPEPDDDDTRLGD